MHTGEWGHASDNISMYRNIDLADLLLRHGANVNKENKVDTVIVIAILTENRANQHLTYITKWWLL